MWENLSIPPPFSSSSNGKMVCLCVCFPQIRPRLFSQNRRRFLWAKADGWSKEKRVWISRSSLAAGGSDGTLIWGGGKWLLRVEKNPGWLIGWLVGLIGWLVGWLVGWVEASTQVHEAFFGLNALMRWVDWLMADWLTHPLGWLMADWLTNPRPKAWPKCHGFSGFDIHPF